MRSRHPQIVIRSVDEHTGRDLATSRSTIAVMAEPSWRRRLESLLGVPATDGNQIDILRNGDEIFASMLEAIRSARRTIDFLTFVYWTGDITIEFADALT